jgi:CobQ-like glutamine amidotransferase family enzyme
VGSVEYAYQARNSMTGREEPDGLRVKNILASYIHLHFLSNPAMADVFVKNVQRAKRKEFKSASKQLEPMHSTRSASDR